MMLFSPPYFNIGFDPNACSITDGGWEVGKGLQKVLGVRSMCEVSSQELFQQRHPPGNVC